MANFTFRNLDRHEASVAQYESLVEALADGIVWSVDEYTHDLQPRLWLEQDRFEPRVQEMWARVEATDHKLRSLLLPTKTCIYGDYPKDYFWLWGYPSNCPELERFLRAMGSL